MKRWLAMTGMSAGLAVAAWAQAATPLHAKVSVNWEGMPAPYALQDLGAKANVEFVFDDALFDGPAPVTLEMDEVAAGRIAMRLLRPHGLTLEDVDGRRPRVVQDDPYREFKVQREEVFEFTRPPTLKRHGDDVTIQFETQGWCDVTVAIEHADGRILRHLASGVLGPNAPEPFVWNSKAQTLLWDGKDDAGVYVDDKDAVTVRVSLGLKPRFERTLFWHPGKPVKQGNWSSTQGSRLAIAPAPEGVFVFDGCGFDHVRLFDRDGDYVRTVYPFPGDKVDEVSGVIWHEFPDGARVPIKRNYYQSTLLQSGHNANNLRYRDGRYRGGGDRGTFSGAAGHAMAVSGNRIALTGNRLSRLAADGGSDGLNLHGPDITSPRTGEGPVLGSGKFGGPSIVIDTEILNLGAKRAALCPNGEWLYLTKYTDGISSYRGITHWRHHVKRMRYDSDDPPTLFLGSHEKGTEDGRFDMPADVATDAQGRLYVADHRNDRVQVFDAEGKHLQNIAVRRPARINIHPETGEMYVFSWGLLGGRGRSGDFTVKEENLGYGQMPRFFQLTRLTALPEAKTLETLDLGKTVGFMSTATNYDQQAAVDFWSDPVRIWLTASSPVASRGSRGRGLVLLTQENGEWTVKRDLLDEAARAVVRTDPPTYFRQRLFVNPANGILYMGEGVAGKVMRDLLRIDPETGRMRDIQLPVSAEDVAFDRDGQAYLKLENMIVRYDPDTWREIPFDYGEERARAGYGSGSSVRGAQVISGAVVPGNRQWHHGGIHVNARGEIAVSALYSIGLETRTDEAQVHKGVDYQPTMYPGRRYDPGGRFGGMLVHILDRHGKMVQTDAVPGLSPTVNGTALDVNGNLYLLEAAARVIGGEMHFNDLTGTLMKFTPGQGRLLNTRGTPVPLTQKPARSPDMRSDAGIFWADGAHWLYGGVGWSGYSAIDGPNCACPNARFVLDYFARSFTPEHDRYNIGVLDSAGNLILRVGRYGNVDDGMPLVKDGGPPNPRPIGGDELALFDARYLATHTDRRLFVKDLGNARLASVKLGYHADETVALKEVPDEGK